jgi:tRNA 2-thiouridine synthesizing protein A
MASTGCCSLAAEPEIIDARGLRCPLPVLKLEKRLETESADHLVILATDPVARIDISLWCRQHGYACEISSDSSGAIRFDIGPETA